MSYLATIAVRIVMDLWDLMRALILCGLFSQNPALPWNWWIYSTHSPLSCLQGGEGGGGFGHAQLR